MGLRVRATTPDTSTAPARVRANSLNRAPVSPPIKAMGAYTAARVRVMAMTGRATSRAPSSAACIGEAPSSICRCTFSTTTIASSTTSPMAITMASRVSRFREKPSARISDTTPISDRGMASRGISTTRSDPRNR